MKILTIKGIQVNNRIRVEIDAIYDNLVRTFKKLGIPDNLISEIISVKEE